MNLINRKMLKIRHFSNRLLANKLGRTFSSNWRSSTKIFGAEFSFSPIQSANGCPNRCIILPKFKELCQRHQFCSAMADGSSIPPFPPHSDQQSANSSPSSIPSPKNTTNVNGEQKTTKLLEYRQLHLNNLNNKILKLILEENGKNGRKFFKIKLLKKGQLINISGIPMTEDGYPFVWGMDNLIGELAAGNIDPQKFEDPPQQSTTAAADSAKSTQIVELSVVEFTGQTRKFQLGLVLFPADDGKGKGEICFQTRISPPLKNESGKWSYLTLPLDALPWLRREMAEMLEKYDGKEPFGEAAQIPRKFFEKDVQHDVPQKLSSAKISDHRRQMRPKIENKIPPKMPTTFSSQQKYSKMEPKIQSTNFDQFGNKKQPEKRAAQFDPQIAEVEQSLRDAILDSKQLRNKRAPRKIEDPLNPTMADLEESLRILFDFEDEEEDSSRGKKYGREAANNGRGKSPRYEY